MGAYSSVSAGHATERQEPGGGLGYNCQGLTPGNPPPPAKPYLLKIIQPLNSTPAAGVPVGDISRPAVTVLTVLRAIVAHSFL